MPGQVCIVINQALDNSATVIVAGTVIRSSSDLPNAHQGERVNAVLTGQMVTTPRNFFG